MSSHSFPTRRSSDLVDSGNVAIFRGVQQDVGPISLSSVYRTTDIDLDALPSYSRSTVEDTIPADSLSDAERIVEQLSNVSTP